MMNEPILQCIIVLKPGLFVTGFIQNERKLSSSGSFSFSSWHTNSLLGPGMLWLRLVVVKPGFTCFQDVLDDNDVEDEKTRLFT